MSAARQFDCHRVWATCLPACLPACQHDWLAIDARNYLKAAQTMRKLNAINKIEGNTPKKKNANQTPSQSQRLLGAVAAECNVNILCYNLRVDLLHITNSLYIREAKSREVKWKKMGKPQRPLATWAVVQLAGGLLIFCGQPGMANWRVVRLKQKPTWRSRNLLINALIYSKRVCFNARVCVCVCWQLTKCQISQAAAVEP